MEVRDEQTDFERLVSAYPNLWRSGDHAGHSNLFTLLDLPKAEMMLETHYQDIFRILMKDQPTENMGVLEATIREHTRKAADDEWRHIHESNLFELLEAAGLAHMGPHQARTYGGILELEEGVLPIERLVQALRTTFLNHRAEAMFRSTAGRIVAEAFKHLDEK